MTYPVYCEASMIYEIDADSPQEAREQAIELFISDVLKNLDIETDIIEER